MSKTKSILELSNIDAKDFFLREKSYCSIDLPLYFKFEPLLKKLSQQISDTGLKTLSKEGKTKAIKILNDVNYKLTTNKDGKLSWREFQIINPVVYIVLCNLITDEKNWNIIKTRFKKFRKYNKYIEATAIPVVANTNICVFHTYDGKATWMDWANLIVSAVGSIFLSFLIYWFGSVIAEEKKERNKQIELINRLFGDYIRSSRKLIYLLNVLSPIKGKLSSAISLIDKKQYTQEQFADTFKVANNIPSSLILFNVKEEEFSLLAKESPELYLNLLELYEKLLNLRDALTQYSIDVKENLEMYRTELKKYGGTPLRGGIITDIEIKNYFERILNHIENPLVLYYEKKKA